MFAYEWWVVPRWVVMWGVAIALFATAKILTWKSSRVRGMPLARQLVYLAAWPGMDADRFFSSAPVPPPSLGEWAYAFAKFCCGVVLLVVVVPVIAARGSPLVVGWVGLFGILATLHFGFFHILSCLWRRAGWDAPPIMCCPLASRGLADFWGRRWNRAFRDLTNRWIFRPLVPRVGGAGALFAGFVFSGVIHDAVISLPAGAGYGLPTSYFTLQGLALLAERSSWGKTAGLGRGVRGWLFCAAVVLLPSGLLFTAPFMRDVIVPFLRALRLDT